MTLKHVSFLLSFTTLFSVMPACFLGVWIKCRIVFQFRNKFFSRFVQFLHYLFDFPENLMNNWDLRSFWHIPISFFCLGCLHFWVLFAEEKDWYWVLLLFRACVRFLGTVMVLISGGLTRDMNKRRQPEPIDFFVWTVEVNNFFSL